VSEKIFMCYRQRDNAGYAGRISDHLGRHFGPGAVFRDVETMPYGDDFVAVVQETVAGCRAFLVIIGPHWLVTGDGDRRLDDPRDFVRLEIESALAKNIRVIPVLIDGARMPAAHELPPGIASIATRHAVEITDGRFEYDITRLIKAIELTRPPTPPAGRPTTEEGPGSPRAGGETPRPPPKRVAIPLGRSYLSVMLCLPLGALAVSESNKCSTALASGDYTSAQAASEAATKWNRLAFWAAAPWWIILWSMLFSALSK
jgi:hypothetical protein